MSHEPLMVSDTAMVLLREYLQVVRDERSVLDGTRSMSDAVKLSIDGRDLNALTRLKMQLRAEILRDVWYVWAYPEVKVIRHLNAHVILDARLMRLFELTFLPPDSHEINRQHRIMRFPRVDGGLTTVLAWAYQQACLRDPQDPVEGML